MEDYNSHEKKHERTEEELNELKELLRKDIELSEKILEMSEYIKNFVFWQKVLGIIKILVILIPLILGIIYLPPLIKKAFEPYKELLNLQKELENAPGIMQFLK